MQDAEKISNYLLWLSERGLRFLTIQSSASLTLRTTSKPEPNTSKKVLFLSDIYRSNTDGTPTALFGEELDLLQRIARAMGLQPPEYMCLSLLPANSMTSLHLTKAELEQGQKSLFDLIQIDRPSIIIPLGLLATSIAMGHSIKWKEIHGQISLSNNLNGLPVLPILHPRDLLRFPQNKRSTWNHLQVGMKYLEKISSLHSNK